MNTARWTLAFVFLVLAASVAAVADSVPPGSPILVPGKEYNNNNDEMFDGSFDPHQNIW